MLDTDDPVSLKTEIKRLERELKKKNRQLSAAQTQLERFSNVNSMQNEIVGNLTTEMSKREKFMTMLLKYSKNIILLLDKELNVAYYTDNFFRDALKSKTVSGIEDKNIFKVFEKYFNNTAATGIQKTIEKAISSKKTQIRKEKIRYSGGEQYLIYYLYVTAILNDEDKLDGVILLYTDITELENARVAAEAASKAKSEFLAKMSHEIRTPMNTIIGMSDLIPQENLNSLQRGYFSDIKKMSKILLGIINDILDFSKAESGKMELLPGHFNINTLFNHICSMQSFIAQQKSLDFKSSYSPLIPEFIYGDEMRINQIFTNLINNAVKYTKEGFVSFSLNMGRCPRDNSDADYLIAKIADTGIGIKQENISRLFESFQQMDTRKNKGIEGTGLGLAIVEQLVSLMKGFIEVESEYGKGSVFTVYLPLVRGDPAKAEKPRQDTQQLIAVDEVRALVVDDVPTNLTVAVAFLNRHHISSDTAEDGLGAIELVKKSFAEKRPYDIIFMDHMMPDMDGIETTRRIRKLEKKQPGEAVPAIPVICLSANAVQGAKELFLSSGMNGFIPKPIEPEVLNDALKKFLPKEKYTLVDVTTNKAAAGKLDAKQERILGELAKIEGLDTAQGLHYAAGNFETYTSTLKQFSSGITRGLALIRDSLVAADWKPYTVQVHAYKGICATIGAGALSEWGKKLEAAAKGDDQAACLAETEAFCSALEEFNAALRGTSLFAETDGTDKTEITAADMAAKLTEFAEACEESHAGRIRALVKELECLRLADTAPDFEAALAQALDLARFLDYDEAAEKARELCAAMEGEGIGPV
ncbi:ATP-binding protein [Treponema sp. TIM-1]|uniref:ATP-binding protein n=1 Tax=Treponema sp. TIM-1 TaxID=2898417 RepID=UPI0039811084